LCSQGKFSQTLTITINYVRYNGSPLQPWAEFRIIIAMAPLLLRLLLAARPWSFPITVGQCLVVIVASWRLHPDQFNAVNAILTLLTVLFAHSASNLTNTYYDALSGADKENKQGGDHTIPTILSLEVVLFLLPYLL